MTESDSRLDPYDYWLPDSAIARFPPPERDGGRLLYSASGEWKAGHVAGMADHFESGDVLIVNDTRVVPARLFGRRETGGAVELLVLESEADRGTAMVRPSKKIKVDEQIVLLDRTGAESNQWVRVGAAVGEGARSVVGSKPVSDLMEAFGVVPLPPYFGRDAEPEDGVRYQTVFAERPGAVAAPTASLHLTEGILEQLKRRGVEVHRLTLHVGAGTFRNLRPEDLDRGRLHKERYSIPHRTAIAVNRAMESGRRITAVGTTVTRALESAWHDGNVVGGEGETDLFIRPGYHFRVINRLMTNFHLPRSSLLMLVCAAAGRDHVLAGYGVAVQQGFRFYSYGDAMLLHVSRGSDE